MEQVLLIVNTEKGFKELIKDISIREPKQQKILTLKEEILELKKINLNIRRKTYERF